jgi:Tfp pilus assembly protein PilO
MILAVVLSLLVAVAFFFLFIRPRQGELADVNEQIETEEARTTQLQAELRRLEDLQARAPELEARLARIRELVPRDDEVPNFIFLVQEAANAAGVDFVQITPELPKTPPEGAAVAEIRASIGAGGSFFSIQDFIRRLHGLDRAVRIDNLTMSAAENESGGVDIQFLSSARVFFEPPEAAAAPVAGATPEATPSP